MIHKNQIRNSRRDFIKSVSLASGSLVLAPGITRAAGKTESSNMLQPTQKVFLYPGEPNPFPLDLGMGYNWFAYLGSGGHYARWNLYPLSANVYPDMEDSRGWLAIEKGLNELKPGWIRFGLPPDPHIGSDGRLLTDTVYIHQLVWLNKWAVKNNCTILLDLFLIPRYYEFPVPEGTTDPGDRVVNMAAADNHSYTRNFVAPLLKHLVFERKLDMVKYFNPVNEPMEYGVYQTPGNTPDVMSHYVDMYRELREALDDAGIDRKRIGLVGLDCSTPGNFILRQHGLEIDIDPYIEAYSVHHYNLRFDYLPPKTTPDCGRNYFVKGLNVVIEIDDRQFAQYSRMRGKPLWAAGMGTFYYGKNQNPEGVATIESTMMAAEGIIRGMNTGVTSFAVWSLMNSNGVDGYWAVMGEKDGELIRHTYPFAVYGMISMHSSPGARVIPMFVKDAPEICHIHAVALEGKPGEKTILLVNDHPEESLTVELQLPGDWDPQGKFTLTLTDRDHLLVPNGTAENNQGLVTLVCPPLSITGLKNMDRSE